MTDTQWITLYWIAVSILVTIEHILLRERWRDFELARRTLGIATIMGGALPLAAAGIIDPYTWITLLVAFGIAGAIVGAMVTTENADRRRTRAQLLKSRIGELLDDTSPNSNHTETHRQSRTRILRK